jgi:hypothetical protein
MEVELEESGAVVTGVVGASISPFASDGLDEAFGLAIGLRAIGASEEMMEAQIFAGGGEEFWSIGRALVGEDGADGDAVGPVEGDGLVESVQDAGGFFIWEEGGKSQTGVIVDGDVEGLGASAWIAVRTVTSGANAWLVETAKLFNIKMKQLSGRGAFVTDDGRLRRIEGSQAVETMALEDAGEGSFWDGKNHEDLSVRTALTTQSEDLVFESWWGFARLAQWDGGTIVERQSGAGELGAFEPLANSFFTDGEGGGWSAQRAALREMLLDHFSSHERGECGISVHVESEVWQAVEYRSTTNLSDPQSADNVLKHDT